MSSPEAEANAENDELLDSDKEDEFDDDSSSNLPSSDDEDSSDPDCDFSEKDKEYTTILNDIEEQYNVVASIYKLEKSNEIDIKTNEILQETAVEYKQPLEELEENRQSRITIAGHLRKFKIQNVEAFLHSENMAAEQNRENEKRLLKDRIRKKIEDMIHKLEEEKFWAENDLTETSCYKRSRKYSDDLGDKRRKPVTVNGPYIVLGLKPEDIAKDIAAISELYSHTSYQFHK